MKRNFFSWHAVIGFFVLLIASHLPSTAQATAFLTSSLTGLTRETSTVLTYSASEGAVSLTRNGMPVTVTSGGSLTLFEGVNTIVATASDAVGNISSASVAATVDTRIQAPTIATTPGIWSQRSYTLSGRMENNSTVVVSAPAGVGVGLITYPTISSWSCPLFNLTTGIADISVVATDPAGNVSPPATVLLVVDLNIPAAIGSGQLTVTDTGQGGTLQVDWNGYAAGSAVTTYALYVSSAPITSITSLTPWRSYPAGTTSAIVTGLADDVPAFIAVVPMNSRGDLDNNLLSVSVVPQRQGVYGTITDYIRKFPLNSMQVTVPGYPGVLTRNDGTYRLTGLPTGSYTVTISEPGGTSTRFNSTSASVTVNPGVMSQGNARLFPKVHRLDPGVPQNCSAEVGDNKATLHWDALTAPDLGGYKIYRDGIVLTGTWWTDNTYVDLTAENGTSYNYTITSCSRTNICSQACSPPTVTPQPLVLPPVDLAARLNCDNTVTLTWAAPLSSDLLGYNIYQQNDSHIDYTDYETISDPAVTTWTSPDLAGGTWTFAVRSYGSSEEENTTVRVTLTIPVDGNMPQGTITIPKAGKRIDGNAVHVQADPATSGCGNATMTSALFQYRPTGTTSWLDIPAALAQHPNPDLSAPFFTKWDVTVLPEADYDLRAVASHSTTLDSDPSFITITIDHHQPQLSENRSSDNSQSAQGFAEKGNEAPVATSLGSALFATQSLSTDTFLTVAALPPELRPGGGTLLAPPVDLSLSSGQKTFTAGEEVELGLAYNDSDNNGVIDGTGFFSQDVLPVAYNSAAGQWEPLLDVTLDSDQKQVQGNTSHFSIFGLTPKAGLPQAASPRRISAPGINTTGVYQVSWTRIIGNGTLYELQQADDGAFTRNVTTVYSGGNNYNNFNSGNGSRYYRVRAARRGYQPSQWTTLAAPVSIDLTCGGIAGIFIPVRNTTGSYALNWSNSRTRGVSYDVEVDDGSGYKYLTTTTSNSLLLNNIPSGTYRYRVMAQKNGYKPSNWTTSTGTTVTLSLGNIAAIYAPVNNSSGSYQIRWTVSRTPGVTYLLSENGREIYRGDSNFFTVTGQGNGHYSYSVRAIRSGYVDSASKGPVTVTVIR